MKKNKKILSALIILVILLSHSIIPVSASSDYYESSYNYYNYDCRSRFTMQGILSGEMSYAGTNKICVEIEYQYYDFDLAAYYTGSVTSTFVTSSASALVFGTVDQYFTWADYTYTIVFNTVYFVGLS